MNIPIKKQPKAPVNTSVDIGTAFVFTNKGGKLKAHRFTKVKE